MEIESQRLLPPAKDSLKVGTCSTKERLITAVVLILIGTFGSGLGFSFCGPCGPTVQKVSQITCLASFFSLCGLCILFIAATHRSSDRYVHVGRP